MFFFYYLVLEKGREKAGWDQWGEDGTLFKKIVIFQKTLEWSN